MHRPARNAVLALVASAGLAGIAGAEVVIDKVPLGVDDPIEITLEDLKERLELPIGAEGVGACERLLEKAGATVTQVAGCCGLAGNFGMEKGHYDVSVAIAETHLLPAVRSQPTAVVLADGMSCRVQLDDLAGVPTMHLAELLASTLER